MVVTYQFVAALPPPTATSWQETIEFESGRTTLFGVLSVVGNQAANVGKELLGIIVKDRVYSSESVYQVLEQCQLIAGQADVKLNCALILYRGSRVAFVTLRMGIGLRRGEGLRMILTPEDGIQVKEGTTQTSDSFVVFSQLGVRFGEKLLQVVNNPTELARVWAEIPTTTQFSQSPGLVVVLLMSASTLKLSNLQSSGLSRSGADLEPVGTSSQNRQANTARSWHFPWKKHTRIRKKPVVIKPITEPSPQTSSSSQIEATIAGSSQDATTQKQTQRGNVSHLTHTVSTWWHTLMPGKQVYVEAQKSKKKWILVSLSVLILLVLITLVSFFWVSRERQQAAVEAQLQPYHEALDSITQLAQTDPLAAREQAQQQLTQLGQELAFPDLSPLAKSQITELIEQTKAVYNSITVSTSLDTFPLFDDLRRFSPAFVASVTTGSNGNATFADQEQKLLIKYDAASQAATLIDAVSLPQITALAQGNAATYILGETVSSLPLSGGNDLTEVIPQSSLASGSTLVASFDDNLYVLNPERRALYRYPRSGRGFGSATNWISGPIPFPLSEVSSMVIDGDVWFGTTKGELYRFQGGKQQKFAISGLEKPLGSTIYLATAPDHDYMYILEPAAKRVLVVKKSGAVVKEFAHNTLGSATGMWIDLTGNRLFIVSGASIYSVPL